MTAEVQRRGALRPITSLPSLVDPTGGFIEIEKAGIPYHVNQGYLGGADPALQPLGTEVAAYSSEFGTLPSDWTWLNQGTSTVTAALSRAILTPQAGGAGTNALRLFAPPTFLVAPWCVRVRLINWSTTAGDGGGIFAYNASNGRIHTLNSYVRASLSTGSLWSGIVAVNDWSGYGTINAPLWGPNNENEGGRDQFLQMRNDGTTIFSDYSPDNARFFNFASTPLATYLGTPTRVGIIANCPSAAPTTGLVGYDWCRAYDNASLNQ